MGRWSDWRRWVGNSLCGRTGRVGLREVGNRKADLNERNADTPRGSGGIWLGSEGGIMKGVDMGQSWRSSCGCALRVYLKGLNLIIGLGRKELVKFFLIKMVGRGE
jgi:hypothetical protein